MVNVLDRQELSILRLRVIDRGADAAAARLAAERLICTARPTVPGLLSDEILIVRRVSDPLPTRARAESPEALRLWRTATERLLEAIRLAAVRPARQFAGADAPAVIFADRAELLACLLRDLATGALATRWWWRAWLSGGTVGAEHVSRSDAVAVALEAAAKDVPAALELLATSGEVVAAVASLRPEPALAITLSVARVHGIHILDQAFQSRARGRTDVARSPWIMAAPEADSPMLVPSQQLLLGMALTLRRAPQLARRENFRHRVAEWWGMVDSPEGMATDAVTGPAREGAPDRSAAPMRAAPARRPVANSQAAAESVGPRGSPTVDRQRSPVVDPRAARGRHQTSQYGYEMSGQGSPGAPNHPRPAPQPTEASCPAPVLSSPVAASDLPRANAGTAAVASRLSGLFFLLNVALFLELYGDFTSPRQPGIALDPWDFVTLIGGALLPGQPTRDPVWTVLGELARREPGTAPGAGFHAPRSWRIPRRWLEAFSDVRGAWTWSTPSGRLRVVHPAGFVAIDVRLSSDPAPVLERELAHYGSPQVRQLDSSRRPTPTRRPALARFVHWVARYIGARLRVALGTRSDPKAVKMTLWRPGTIAVSPVGVIVTFQLKEFPLALRIAGLDRDAGWIPAAGRTLTFHFV
jgi:hypothetical protein